MDGLAGDDGGRSVSVFHDVTSQDDPSVRGRSTFKLSLIGGAPSSEGSSYQREKFSTSSETLSFEIF